MNPRTEFCQSHLRGRKLGRQHAGSLKKEGEELTGGRLLSGGGVLISLKQTSLQQYCDDAAVDGTGEQGGDKHAAWDQQAIGDAGQAVVHEPVHNQRGQGEVVCVGGWV